MQFYSTATKKCGYARLHYRSTHGHELTTTQEDLSGVG